MEASAKLTKITIEMEGQDPQVIEVGGFVIVATQPAEKGMEWNHATNVTPMILPMYLMALWNFVNDVLFGTNQKQQQPKQEVPRIIPVSAMPNLPPFNKR